MKRLLFISMIWLFAVSCQPAEITCDCTGTGTGGGSVTVSGGISLIDTNLTGHWKQSNVNNPNSSSAWNNGQIDLHFFADGTWDIDSVSGTNYGGEKYDIREIIGKELYTNDFKD